MHLFKCCVAVLLVIQVLLDEVRLRLVTKVLELAKNALQLVLILAVEYHLPVLGQLVTAHRLGLVTRQFYRLGSSNYGRLLLAKRHGLVLLVGSLVHLLLFLNKHFLLFKQVLGHNNLLRIVLFSVIELSQLFTS